MQKFNQTSDGYYSNINNTNDLPKKNKQFFQAKSFNPKSIRRPTKNLSKFNSDKNKTLKLNLDMIHMYSYDKIMEAAMINAIVFLIVIIFNIIF